jgi:hypothetical protein
MHIGLTTEISSDIIDKAKLITSLSDEMNLFFQSKSYGSGIDTILIGIICVRPAAQAFFSPRKRYLKARKYVEYDIQFDHMQFGKANNIDSIKMLITEILNSTQIIEEFGIARFDAAEFKRDLETCFNKI